MNWFIYTDCLDRRSIAVLDHLLEVTLPADLDRRRVD